MISSSFSRSRDWGISPAPKDTRSGAAMGKLAPDHGRHPQDFLSTLAQDGHYVGDKPAMAMDYAGLAADVPKGKNAALAHWKVCWRAYLDDDPRAHQLFEQHVRRYPRSGQVSASLYWLARLDEKAGSVASARALYIEIDSRYPNHYCILYGWDFFYH